MMCDGKGRKVSSSGKNDTFEKTQLISGRHDKLIN